MKQPTPPPSNAVEKALRILCAFTADRPMWGVRELSGHLGFSPATVQRLLQTLRSHGFVNQDPQTRHYRLGSIYYSFLHTLQSGLPVGQAAVPFMKQLLAQTRETVHLNVIDDTQRLCIETLESARALKASMPIGSRSPLHAGASSKCLLAYSPPEFVESFLVKGPLPRITENTITDRERLRAELELIRSQGYAASLGETIPGLGSLSAPVLNHRSVLLAAVSLAVPEIRFRDEEHRQHCLMALRKAVSEISKVMGYQG
jgi:DNA-binding IclR family transcriptional regulator